MPSSRLVSASPAEQSASPRRVRLEDQDLASVRSDARRVLDDLGVHPEEPARQREQLADRVGPAGAELDRPPLEAVGRGGTDEPLHRVRHVREVAPRVEPAEVDLASGPASSWRSIVGRTARSDWRGPYVLNGRRTSTGTPIAAVEGEGQLVGGDLGGRVRRLGLERMASR